MSVALQEASAEMTAAPKVQPGIVDIKSEVEEEGEVDQRIVRDLALLEMDPRAAPLNSHQNKVERGDQFSVPCQRLELCLFTTSLRFVGSSPRRTSRTY